MKMFTWGWKTDSVHLPDHPLQANDGLVLIRILCVLRDRQANVAGKQFRGPLVVAYGCRETWPMAKWNFI